jgi:hypothetical protein
MGNSEENGDLGVLVASNNFSALTTDAVARRSAGMVSNFSL